MDFFSQTEELLCFLNLNLSKTNLILINDLKTKFLNDYNLIASFIKDYLTLKNSYIICEDENIYKNFVEYYKKNCETIGEDLLILDLYKHAKYYLVFIFEKKFEFNLIDNEIIGYIETINLFYALEVYPYLLQKFDKFLNLKIDRNIFCSVLKSLVDIIVNRNIDSNTEKIDLVFLDYEINKILLGHKDTSGRLVG